MIVNTVNMIQAKKKYSILEDVGSSTVSKTLRPFTHRKSNNLLMCRLHLMAQQCPHQILISCCRLLVSHYQFSKKIENNFFILCWCQISNADSKASAA